MISSERAPQEEQNDVNFSFIAPSSEELSVCKETSQSTYMYMHGKGRHACKCVGKCFDGISP